MVPAAISKAVAAVESSFLVGFMVIVWFRFLF
jgi:hypothetical protein